MHGLLLGVIPRLLGILHLAQNPQTAVLLVELKTQEGIVIDRVQSKHPPM